MLAISRYLFSVTSLPRPSPRTEAIPLNRNEPDALHVYNRFSRHDSQRKSCNFGYAFNIDHL